MSLQRINVGSEGLLQLFTWQLQKHYLHVLTTTHFLAALNKVVDCIVLILHGCCVTVVGHITTVCLPSAVFETEYCTNSALYSSVAVQYLSYISEINKRSPHREEPAPLSSVWCVQNNANNNK